MDYHRKLSWRDGNSWRDVEESLVIISSESMRAHQLNPSSSWIYKKLNGSKNLQEVFALFLEEFDVDEATARVDFEKTIEDFLKEGVIQ